MKGFLLGLGATLLALSVYNYTQTSNEISPEILVAYSVWKNDFNKKYGSFEDQYRLAIFSENYLKVMKHNADPTQTYELGINQFMDLDQEEFASIYLTRPHLVEDESTVERVGDEDFVPNGAVDWTSKVIVKNQGNCGSCWSFGATGAMEAYFLFEKGQKLNLAEQELVDCDTKDGGCNGGFARYGVAYGAKNGMVDQSTYPYTARKGTCKHSTGPYKVNGVQRYSATTSAVQSAVSKRPVGVAVDATNWSLYKGGVFSNCRNSLNHEVLLVGYDSSSNWIVRNSWGTGWGESGFIRLAPGDTCGVLDDAYHAV